MCRNIRKLRLPGGPASRADIEASALQYVRKVSGFQRPSVSNSTAFTNAVRQVADVTEALLQALKTGRSAAPASGATDPRGG